MGRLWNPDRLLAPKVYEVLMHHDPNFGTGWPTSRARSNPRMNFRLVALVASWR